MTACTVNNWLLRGIIFLSLLAIAVFLVVEIYDLDIWWQLAIGRGILDNGHVPTIDQYTVAAFGRPYHDSHWLFQLLMAAADSFLGLTGVQFVMILIWAVGLYSCWRSMRRNALSPAVATLWLVLVSMACSERFLPRPEIVTLALIAVYYERLQRGAYVEKVDLLIFFVLQILWSNSHGLFVLGPFLVGSYLGTAIIFPVERDQLKARIRLLLVVLFATLMTPFGFGSWKYAWLLFTEVGGSASELMKSVGELSPTFGSANLHGFSFWFYLVFLVVTALACAGAFVRRQRQVSWPRLLIVLVLFFLSLTGRRNMALFVLVAAPFAAEQLPAASITWLENRLCRPVYGGMVILLLLLLIWYPLSGKYYLKFQFPTRSGFGATPSFFPHGLQTFLNQTGFIGQVFNSNSIGGFYLYQTPPGNRAFSDGRWEIYPSDAFSQISRGMQNSGTWREFSERNSIAGILLQHASLETKVLVPILRQGKEWKLIYCDHAASFWVPMINSALPAPLNLNVAELNFTAQRVEDTMILDLFLKQMEAWPGRLRNVQSGLAFDPNNRYLLAALGETELNLRHLVEAEQAFIRLYQQDDENIRALNELAFFAYQRGEKARAAELLTRVLALEPGNTDARANLQRIQGAQ